MKNYFQPRPSRRDLAKLPLHVIVRDFPETLAPLRQLGLPLEALGARTPSELEDADVVLDAVEAGIRWRPPGGRPQA